MEIQKILFPQVGRCTDREMYFRLEKSGFGSNQMLFYDNEKQTILFRTGEKVWFDTYFNGFRSKMEKVYDSWSSDAQAGTGRKIQGDTAE